MNLIHLSTWLESSIPSHHTSGRSGSSPSIPSKRRPNTWTSTSDWVFSPCLEDFHGVIHAGKGIVKESWPPFLRQLREDLWRGNVDLCFHCVPHNCLVKDGQVSTFCPIVLDYYIYISFTLTPGIRQKLIKQYVSASTSSSSYVLGDDHHLSTCQGGGTPISRFSSSQALCQEALRGTCQQLGCQLDQVWDMRIYTPKTLTVRPWKLLSQ